MEQKKLITIIILAATLILAGIAGFTAFNLWQLGKKPEIYQEQPYPEPSSVGPIPSAEEAICELSFTVGVGSSPSPSPSLPPSPSPSPSQPPSPSPSPSLPPSPSPSPSSLPIPSPSPVVYIIPSPTPQIVYATPSPTPPPKFITVVPSPIPSPITSPEIVEVPVEQLPSAGTSLPTIILALGGILLVVLGFVL